jgi:hypothetical protein
VAREANSQTMEREATLISDSCGEWQMNQIPYDDNTSLVADVKCKLQRLITEF